MSELPEYVFDREFDAPLELVWRAWTDAELLARWYGPGVETIIHEFDFRPGGVWRNEMKMGGGSDLSKMEFQEVVPEKKIVWIHASVDENWQVAPSKMMPNWPQKLLTTVTFDASGKKTNVRLSQVPVDASDVEVACFSKMMAGMDNGWGTGYKIIDEILTNLKVA